jgi:uncharacterized protein YdaT
MEALGIIGTSVGLASFISGGALYVIRAEISKDRAAMETELARTNGRIDTHEASCTERQRKLDERHEAIQNRLASIDHRSELMDGKLDRLLERRA